jgi:polysaccharide export outer membrane protein
MIRKIIFFGFLVVYMSSCVSKKTITYFQNDNIDQSKVINIYKTIFKPDDLLQITISSKNIDAARPFNLSTVSYATTTNSVNGVPLQQPYLIDSQGEIDFPILGKIKVGGLTRKQAIEVFKNKLDPKYIKSPSVIIRISNFKISILGDVRTPGVYNIPNERITILEAIGLAGDLNISAQRFNVKVFREDGNEKKEFIVDFLSKEIFTSPVFYLKQNDIVYVEPNDAKSQFAKANQNTGIFISIGSIIISLLTIITR